MKQNSATDAVLKYPYLEYLVICVFYSFCAATVKLGVGHLVVEVSRSYTHTHTLIH